MLETVNRRVLRRRDFLPTTNETHVTLRSHRAEGMPLTTAIVGYHDPYHDADSGYEHFHPFVNSEWIDVHKQLMRRAPLIGRLRGRLAVERTLLARLRGFRVAHFIYPEAHLLFADRASNSLKSVVTLHLPFAFYFEQRPTTGARLWLMNRGLVKALRRCAGVILLDDLERDRWQAALPKAKFAVIPHGVNDHAAWVQATPSDAQQKSIAVIGRNYRDWALLERVLARSAATRPDWRFHLVGVPAHAETLRTRFVNVVAYPRLSHEEYMRLLAGCHVNFLPVTFASANNALLEAHSLGVPTVMSDTPGGRGYAVSTTAFFHDEGGAIHAIDSALDESTQVQRRAATREESTRFFWSSLAPRFSEFYEAIDRED